MLLVISMPSRGRKESCRRAGAPGSLLMDKISALTMINNREHLEFEETPAFSEFQENHLEQVRERRKILFLVLQQYKGAVRDSVSLELSSLLRVTLCPPPITFRSS